MEIPRGEVGGKKKKFLKKGIELNSNWRGGAHQNPSVEGGMDIFGSHTIW